jgi:methyl-accepting chemotaxis protein
LLLAERFVRAATGLVIILGLLGTFYGLTLSIGKVVHLVAADADAAGDVAKTLTGGLTQALSGMAVAFSNSLLGVTSAVVLTVFGVFSNVTDRRVAFMIQVEAYLERALAEAGPPASSPPSSIDARADGLERVVTGFGHSVERLEGAVARFESALQAFSGSTREFNEFNSHLKDNVQRMSLSFGDFSDAMKTEIDSLKANGR